MTVIWKQALVWVGPHTNVIIFMMRFCVQVAQGSLPVAPRGPQDMDGAQSSNLPKTFLFSQDAPLAMAFLHQGT